MNTHRSPNPSAASRRRTVPQALRWLVVPLVLVATSIAVFNGVASSQQGGIGAGSAPGFPSVVTVGETNVAAFILIENRNTGANAGDTNIVCNVGDDARGRPCPPGDPGITLIPSCGRLGDFSACNSDPAKGPIGADPGVFELVGPFTGSGACAGFIFDVAEENAQFGRVRLTPRGGLNVTLAGNGATCRIDFKFNVLRAPSVDASAFAGLQTIQITDNTQYSTTTLTTASARGTSLPVTVNKAQPTIATQASPDVALGGQLTDVAVVSGRVNPLAGATISFRLYGPDDATCAGAPVFESLNVPYPVAGGPVTSAPFTPTAPGVYRWRASYSGDANNNPVAGACNETNENVTVLPPKAVPAIATQASGNIVLGGQITDIAVVSGRVNPVNGATIDFRLYGPNDATCSGAPVFESLGVPYPVAGGPVTSAPFTPTAPGVYRWRASYSGDANNAAVAGACNEPNESVTVTQPGPTIATTASPNVVLGGQLVDVAIVSGRFNPVAGATIDFRLYGPNDDNCSGAPIFESLAVPYPVAGGPVTSAAYVPSAPGVYRWRAFYSGDANNSAVAGACNEPNETTVVLPAPLNLPPGVLPETE